MRARMRGDDGATLVVALIFITVVALGLAVTLSFADTSLRATRALRDQAAGVANADGAAQVAINALRKGTYNGTSGNCFGGSNTMTLSNFYQPPSGPADSAFVTCELDTTRTATDPNVTITSANKPPFAILTLETTSPEVGLHLKVSGNRTLRVKGPVYSSSSIWVEQGTLNSTSAVTARSWCAGTIVSTPPADCNNGPGSSQDPNYSAPGDDRTERNVPTCGDDDVVIFSPGRYTDVRALNNRTRSNGCRDSTFWFRPGTYYFDFDRDEPWVIDTGYVVAGTPTSTLMAGSPPAMPGSCQSPFPPDPPGGWTEQTGGGVAFVFGGASRIAVRDAKVEICGTYSETRPPIAVYGLKSALGNGSSQVPAQNGCIVDPDDRCPVIETDNSPDSRLFIHGTTYVPRSRLEISLNNNTGQVFGFGVVAHSLYLNPTASANLDRPVIRVPDDYVDFGRRTVVYLTVRVCPGASTCSASGRLRLRAKVGIFDLTDTPEAGDRDIMVYSWSVQR
jgi:Tfp pilus assembly protein PilX